jgi:RNA polymerase sigma-70 factor (ECF subfamily)
MRVYALSLTRDRDRADDLVQQTSLNALVGRESFRPGTNFGGWIFRIQRNEFITQVRCERRTVDSLDAEAEPATPPVQENRLVMCEFMVAFRQLSRSARQALILSKLEGHTYQQIAKHVGIAEATVKTRIWRGRAALERLLSPETASPRDAHRKIHQASLRFG